MKQRKKLNRRALNVESLEERRVLAASVGWDGPGAGSAQLSYYVGQSPNGISQSTFETAIESALKAWSDVAKLTFVQTTQAGLNNSLDFTSSAIDGSGGTLAQAYFPSDVNRGRLAGDVEFDAAERWEVGNSLGSAAFDLVLVAVHEIGHALGLEHSNDPSAVLYPSVSPSQSFKGLAAADVSAIRSLYAATPGSTSTDVTPVSSNTGTTNSGTTHTWTRTPRYTFNSWFANWHSRFGRLNSGVEQLDSTIPANLNLSNPLDVNLDDTVSPVDALIVINILNDHHQLTIEINYKGDTNGDGQISPVDALLVINGLANPSTTTPDTTTPDIPTDTGNSTDTGTDLGETHDHPHHFGHGRRGFGFPIALGGGLTPERVDNLFTNFDVNLDGLLTEDEVPSRLWARWVEDGVDSNDDLAISALELNAAVRAKQQKQFDSLDADSDGLLSETEVSTQWWKRLSDAKADTDANGGISFAELLVFQATASTNSHCDDNDTAGTTSNPSTPAMNSLHQNGFATQFSSAIRSMARKLRR